MLDMSATNVRPPQSDVRIGALRQIDEAEVAAGAPDAKGMTLERSAAKTGFGVLGGLAMLMALKRMSVVDQPAEVKEPRIAAFSLWCSSCASSFSCHCVDLSAVHR